VTMAQALSSEEKRTAIIQMQVGATMRATT
jgi:hypothetical protein